MSTDRKGFSVGSVVFSSNGETARIQIWDNYGGFWVIVDRESEFKLYRQDAKNLSIGLESKLRRLIKDYDRLGKRSIGL